MIFDAIYTLLSAHEKYSHFIALLPYSRQPSVSLGCNYSVCLVGWLVGSWRVIEVEEVLYLKQTCEDIVLYVFILHLCIHRRMMAVFCVCLSTHIMINRRGLQQRPLRMPIEELIGELDDQSVE